MVMEEGIKYIISASVKKLFGRKSAHSKVYEDPDEKLAEELRKLFSDPNCFRMPYTMDEVMSLPEKARDVVFPSWREWVKA